MMHNYSRFIFDFWLCIFGYINVPLGRSGLQTVSAFFGRITALPSRGRHVLMGTEKDVCGTVLMAYSLV